MFLPIKIDDITNPVNFYFFNSTDITIVEYHDVFFMWALRILSRTR